MSSIIYKKFRCFHKFLTFKKFLCIFWMFLIFVHHKYIVHIKYQKQNKLAFTYFVLQNHQSYQLLCFFFFSFFRTTFCYKMQIIRGTHVKIRKFCIFSHFCSRKCLIIIFYKRILRNKKYYFRAARNYLPTYCDMFAIFLHSIEGWTIT